MKVNEIFYSIQGEGRHSGLPTIFVRFTGCNLRCSYCDTKYAYRSGYELSISEVCSQIMKYQCKRICFTGGEPLLQKDIYKLMKRMQGYTISIETNGTLDIKKAKEYASISLDIKSPSSGHSKDMLMHNLLTIGMSDQVKFIVGTAEDVDFAINIIKKYSLTRKTNVIMNPIYGLDHKFIVSAILESGLDIRVGTQLHKLIWGNKKGV
jgi:7-carboxy-7-deazaguanine synthase